MISRFLDAPSMYQSSHVRDFYRILGVPRSATAAEISAAFRKLAPKFHPDACPSDQQASAKIRAINEAYEVLSDPEKRRRYDRETFPSVPTQRALGPGVWQAEPLFSAASGWSLFDSALGSGEFLAGRFPTGGCFRPGPSDIEAELPLTPEEAIRGASCELLVTVSRPCSCQTEAVSGGSAEPCSRCGGAAEIRSRRPVRVVAPPGIRQGALLRVPGGGRPGSGLAPDGDLYLRVSIRPCW